MNATEYVTAIANASLLSSEERTGIHRSLEFLQKGLEAHFNKSILSEQTVKQHFAFGSYTRDTILPRRMDEHSDIDYMVVFSDTNLKPQTHLNQLRVFAENWYSRSEIFQSNPTIVLLLNHIKFELVPAKAALIFGYQIPAKASSYADWTYTNPHDFKALLIQKDRSYTGLITPLVRLLKYWNALNNYPYESFDLEKNIVEHFSSAGRFFSIRNLWNYFTDFITALPVSWLDPTSKQQAVSRTKNLVVEIRHLESSGASFAAHEKLRQLLPPIS